MSPPVTLLMPEPPRPPRRLWLHVSRRDYYRRAYLHHRMVIRQRPRTNRVRDAKH